MRVGPTIFAVILFVLLIVAIGYLAFQNGFSNLWPKFIPAVFVGLVAALFSIWFSLKSETMDMKFISTVFFHESDKMQLDEHFPDHHRYGGAQFGTHLQNFINSHITQYQNLGGEGSDAKSDEVGEFYRDALFIELLARFFWMYADWWDVRIVTVRRGTAVTSSVSPIKPVTACGSLGWDDLLRDLDSKGDFARLIKSFSESYSIKKMSVPPKTKVKLMSSKHEATLKLVNAFSEISITFNKHGGSRGLGDYQWLLGYDNKKNNEFWSEHFEVVCEAKFEKIVSLNADMIRYKRWAETMFAEVQYQFDDKSRLRRALDYHDLINK